MEEQIKQLNEKLIKLENRVINLEIINKKRTRNKIIIACVSIALIIIIVILYAVVLSKIYGKYINLF